MIYAVDVDRLKARISGLENGGEVDILYAGYWYTTPEGSTGYEPAEIPCPKPS